QAGGMVWKRAGSKPSVKSPSGGATERSVASSEACRVVIAAHLFGVGGRGSRVASFTAKATEGVKSLDCSPEELPGVEGAERSDGGGGNWGGPPRPGSLRLGAVGSVASYNRW